MRADELMEERGHGDRVLEGSRRRRRRDVDRAHLDVDAAAREQTQPARADLTGGRLRMEEVEEQVAVEVGERRHAGPPTSLRRQGPAPRSGQPLVGSSAELLESVEDA